MSIGKKIMDLRSEKKLTQEKLAEKLNITRQTLSNWESGITSPDLKQAKKLANIFKISLDELAGNDLNVIQEKLINTERLAIKQTKYIKIFLVTIYFILLILVIGVGIYYFNKRDFTTYSQLDFVCSGIFNDVYDESSIQLSYEPGRCRGDDCEKYGWKDGYWHISISSNINMYDSTDIILGTSAKDALEDLNAIKRVALEQGFVCK